MIVAASSPTRADVVARLAGAQKSGAGSPAYTRWVNRPLGRQIAAIAYLRDWTPNQLTVVGSTLTLAGIAGVAGIRPSVWSGLVVAGLLAIGYVLDSADGQLARLRHDGSSAGEWLDHVADSVKCATIHLAVAICWFRHYELASEWLLLVPIAFAVKQNVFYFAIMLTEQLRRMWNTTHGLAPAARTSRSSTWYSFAVLPADYGVLCLAFVLIGFHTAFGFVYGALMAANVSFLLLSLPRWYREMRSYSDVKTRGDGT